jgi:hypothetical protein
MRTIQKGWTIGVTSLLLLTLATMTRAQQEAPAPGAQQCLMGARHTVAMRTSAAQRRRCGGRKGALFFLSVLRDLAIQSRKTMTGRHYISMHDVPAWAQDKSR